MRTKSITIKDVAKKAGVSIATVSRYMNNPSSVKGKNRVKLEQIVKDLNYKPLLYARRLAGGKMNTYGLIIPGYEDIFYSFYALETIRGVAAALNKRGVDLHLHIAGSKDSYNSSLVEGIIFADVIENMEQLRRLARENVPIVVINKKIEDIDVSYVAIDNFKGGYDATEFLIQHGHRDIVHLAGDLRVQCAMERLEGYKAALAKAGLPYKEELVKIINFSDRETRIALEEMFELRKFPSSIFCCSDKVAREVLIFAEEKGIKIPDDLSIIGFDDNQLMSYGHYMLTTVRQPLIEMAEEGVKMLMEIVNGKMKKKCGVMLKPEVIIRDTVSFYKKS